MSTTQVDKERTDASTLVHKMAGAIAHGAGALTTGDVAGLRRMDPRRLDAPGFWKLAGLYLDDQLPGDAAARRELETAWGAILIGLSHLGSLHVPGERLGHALARADLSELRFIRLLRTDTNRLIDELPALARFLKAKQVGADWSWAARLLLSEIRGRGEDTRRALARDYYSTLASKEKSQ